MLDRELIEQIDACRPLGISGAGAQPATDDMAEPELARLAEALRSDSTVRAAFASVQQMDARLAAAFDDVRVPADLSARILERLATDRAALQPAAGTETAVSQFAGDRQPSSLGERAISARTRREWLKVGGWVAAGLLLAASVALYQAQPSAKRADLADEAAGWFRELGANWRPVAQAPNGYPVPPALAAVPAGWQALTKNIGAKGIAYQFANRGAGRAVLFVLSGRRLELPLGPPQMPQSTTAGLAIASWQSTSGLTYVLVVEGDERAYRKLFHTARPLA